jgi:hypothetical protein
VGRVEAGIEAKGASDVYPMLPWLVPSPRYFAKLSIVDRTLPISV